MVCDFYFTFGLYCERENKMNKVFITAEIGVNHNGDMAIAKALIDFAKIYGADAVKFQLWESDTFPELENLRMKSIDFLKIKDYCENKNLRWYATAFDEKSVHWLNSMSMDIWKIPSNKTVIYDEKLVKNIFDIAVSKEKNKIFVSAGLFNDFGQVDSFIYKYLQSYNKIILPDKIFILYCISEYPVKLFGLNLHTITNWDFKVRTNYNFSVGISDHSGHWEIPLAAVGAGARSVEVHLTLDKDMEGPDHKASLEPHEFKRMVKAIRNIEKAL